MAISKVLLLAGAVATGFEAYHLNQQQTAADLANLDQFRAHPEAVTVYTPQNCNVSDEFCVRAMKAAAERYGRESYNTQGECAYRFSTLSCQLGSSNTVENRPYDQIMNPSDEEKYTWRTRKENGYPSAFMIAYRPTVTGFAVVNGDPATAVPVYMGKTKQETVLPNQIPVMVAALK